MKKFKIISSVTFLLLTAYSFGENDHEGHEGFEGVHAFPFSSIAVVLVLVLIAIAGFLISKRLKIKAEELNKTPLEDTANGQMNFALCHTAEELNETARKVVSERFAKGEISIKEYDNIFYKLEQSDSEPLETAKLRLAKGEIDLEEYDDIYIAFLRNQMI